MPPTGVTMKTRKCKNPDCNKKLSMYNTRLYCYTCINTGKARLDPEFNKDGRGKKPNASLGRPQLSED